MLQLARENAVIKYHRNSNINGNRLWRIMKNLDFQSNFKIL